MLYNHVLYAFFHLRQRTPVSKHPAHPITRITMAIKIFFFIAVVFCTAFAMKQENRKREGDWKPQRHTTMATANSMRSMSKPNWTMQSQRFNARQSRKMKRAKQRCFMKPALICNLRPIGGSTVSGSVLFTPAFKMMNNQPRCSVRIRAWVKGLTSKYQAIHIHQYGDISDMDGASTGGHFLNPWGKSVMHGRPGDKQRHWGDFGNLVNRNGSAKYYRMDSVITLTGIVGRAITVHAGRDKGAAAQPSGDAGPRVADCVIGFANPETLEMYKKW